MTPSVEASVRTVSEDPIIAVKLSTPGGLTVELEIDRLPRDVIADLFEDANLAGKRIHLLTGLKTTIEQKIVTSFS